jgi:acetoin utilization protein AcuB
MIVARRMTLAPATIEIDRSLAEALETMRARNVRHLPVFDLGKIVGVLSDRDVFRLTSVKAVDPEVLTVGEAMSPEPYVVDPEDDVGAVARGMAERSVGSAVVMRGATLLGVFTTSDALRLLAEVLAG